MQWFGDLRYRMAKKQQAEDDTRNYQQIRARLGVDAEVNDNVRAGLRLATGTSPLSTNQALGDAADPGMPRRYFGIDQAYLNWNYLEGGNLWAGRTPNPFWTPGKSQTIFDSDLSFEGLAIKYQLQPKSSRLSGFLNIGGFIISENYVAPEDLVDVGILGGDLGFVFKSDSWTWTTHGGNYYFLNIQDKEVNTANQSAAIDPYSYPFDRYSGNTVYPNDPNLPKAQRKYYFANQYILLEAGTEWKQKLGAFELTGFIEWIHNDKTGDEAQEYGLGVKWKWLGVGYAFINKSSDSLVGAFTDDDAGGGGTDYRSTRLTADAQVTKNVAFDVAVYGATRGVSTVPRKYSATYINALLKF